MSHTPGPWEWQTSDLLSQVAAPHATVLNILKDGPDPDDAALLAAAPDLLEACRAFLRAPSRGSNAPGSVLIEVQSYNLKAARAAIAKAEATP